MITREIMKDQLKHRNSNNNLEDSRITACDENCQKKGKRNMVLLGLVFIILFISGYFINPSILRTVWLIASGTLAVITGLILFLVQIRIVSLKC